jgi:hypothetical protein
VIAFRPDLARQRAAKVRSGTQAVQHMSKVEFRPPAELTPHALVDIDAVDPREQPRAA